MTYAAPVIVTRTNAILTPFPEAVDVLANAEAIDFDGMPRWKIDDNANLYAIDGGVCYMWEAVR